MNTIELLFDTNKSPPNMLRNSVVLDKDDLHKIKEINFIGPILFVLILALCFFVCYSLTGGDGWIIFGGLLCYIIFATCYIDYSINVLTFYIEKIIKEHKKNYKKPEKNMTITEEDIKKSSLVRLVVGRMEKDKK